MRVKRLPPATKKERDRIARMLLTFHLDSIPFDPLSDLPLSIGAPPQLPEVGDAMRAPWWDAMRDVSVAVSAQVSGGDWGGAAAKANRDRIAEDARAEAKYWAQAMKSARKRRKVAA